MGVTKPGGPHARRAAAKGSYPTSEVRGKRPRVPSYDGAGTAERSHPAPKARVGSQEAYPASEIRGNS